MTQDIKLKLELLGAKTIHASALTRAWLQAKPLGGAFHRRRIEDFLPLALRNALPALNDELQRLVTVKAVFPGANGERLLLALADGQTIESVLLPRGGVCVSTQVGCAVGCVFCMTGRSGLLRQLGSAEIVAQVVVARARRPIKKVVFMGMGEPAHNLDNVLEAIDLLGNEGGIGHKNLVFSTVGDRRVFERLPQGRVKPALAISLHTTDAALREQLLPKAPRIPPEELIELGEQYARATGYPIQYQWTLLDGVNDSDAEIDRLATLLKGRYAMMNFIPFNAIEGEPFARPSWEKAKALAAALQRRGIVTRLRDSAGQDVDGGCGQLRARAVAALSKETSAASN